MTRAFPYRCPGPRGEELSARGLGLRAVAEFAGVPGRWVRDRVEGVDVSTQIADSERLADEVQPSAVELMPKELGEYLFSCGMGMGTGTRRGWLIIEAAS